MNTVRLTLRVLAIAVFTLTLTSLAQAQATRTWVSGVGDDANPCSRTAPCKTFAGAISKTAAGGEISVLDPGGYGAVTITKSITIDGGTGSGWGSILASGTNGIIVNAGVNDVVILRNLSLNGATTGISGIRVIQAKDVYVENCLIFGFKATSGTGFGRGINDNRTNAGARLFISDTTIENNGQSGVVILPTSPSTNRITVSIERSRLIGNGNSGLAALTGSLVTIRDSLISGNTSFGIAVEQPAGTTEVNVENCVVSHNGTGIALISGTPAVRLSNVTVANNTTAGVSGTAVTSFGNNKIAGNGGGNGLPAGSSVIAVQ